MPPVPPSPGAELRFPDDGGCFGCSASNPAGLQLGFVRDGDVIRSHVRVPDRFHGAPGVVHGGIVATLLDEISCAAIFFGRNRRVVTGELGVRYSAPCPVEAPLLLEARVVDEAHPRYAVVEASVADATRVVARSSGKFFYSTKATAP